MEDTKKYLKQLTQGGKRKIYVIQRSVSSSGMTRKLSLFVLKNNSMIRITQDVANVLGWKTDNNGDLRVTGCGMDMHFHTVYSLSGMLYGYNDKNAYKLKFESI